MVDLYHFGEFPRNILFNSFNIETYLFNLLCILKDF